MKTVTIHHPDTGQQTDVFETAVKHHTKRGWKVGALPTDEPPAPVGQPRRLDTSKSKTSEKVS